MRLLLRESRAKRRISSAERMLLLNRNYVEEDGIKMQFLIALFRIIPHILR